MPQPTKNKSAEQVIKDHAKVFPIPPAVERALRTRILLIGMLSCVAGILFEKFTLAWYESVLAGAALSTTWVLVLDSVRRQFRAGVAPFMHAVMSASNVEFKAMLDRVYADMQRRADEFVKTAENTYAALTAVIVSKEKTIDQTDVDELRKVMDGDTESA